MAEREQIDALKAQIERLTDERDRAVRSRDAVVDSRSEEEGRFSVLRAALGEIAEIAKRALGRATP